MSDPIVDVAQPLDSRMDDLTSVLDSAGSKEAVLFGCFEGGPLCALYAATHPGRTKALVLYATYARGAWAPDYPWAWTDQELADDLERLEERLGADYSDRWFEEAVPSLTSDARARAWWRKQAQSSSPGAQIALEQLEHATDIRSILPSIRVPTLVLNRTDDRIAELEEGRWLAAQVPDATFIELAGEDHPPWAGDQGSVLTATSRFLGVRPPPVEPDRVLATVMFTDIVGSTETASRLGDKDWGELLHAHNDVVRREVDAFRGREIDTAGDGFLVTFDGPARAVRCAQAIVSSVDALGLEIRAGCHTGEIQLAGDDVMGIAVHIGARIAARAGPSEVLVSQTVRDLVAGSGLVFEDAGEHALKGVPDRWRLFRVVDSAGT